MFGTKKTKMRTNSFSVATYHFLHWYLIAVCLQGQILFWCKEKYKSLTYLSAVVFSVLSTTQHIKHFSALQ